MRKKAWVKKGVCLLLAGSLFSVTSCVTSSKGLGQFSERMVSERKIKKEEALSAPITQITKKPTVAEPHLGIKVLAEAVKRETFLQKYEKLEKVQQTTSGEGLMILGGVTSGVGLLSWLIYTLMASPDSMKTDEENEERKDKYQPKASQGATITLLGLIPLIIGASTDKQIIVTDKQVDTFEMTITRDTNIGRRVPLGNLVVSASVKNNQTTFSTSNTTDQDGNTTIKIDNILSDAIATAKTLPRNITVEVKPHGGQTARLPLSIEEAIAIMSGGEIDWSTAPEGLTPYPERELKIAGVPKASQTVILQLHISNKKGKGDCYRLQAYIKSDEPLFNRRILVGRVKTGAEITVQHKIDIPRLWQDRVIPFSISFEELYQNYPDPIPKARLMIEGLPRPALAYSYQIVDDGTGNSVGNGDGQAQKGEALDIEVTVNNTGLAPAKDVLARLSFATAPGEGVKLQRKSFSLGDLAPNESKKGRFTMAIKKIAQIDQFKLALDISEKHLNVSTTDTIDIKLGAPTGAKAIVMNPKPAYVTVDEITVRGGASADSIERFRLKKDSPLSITGQIGDWYKVDLGSGRTGWIAKTEVTLTAPKDVTPATAAAAPSVIEVLQKAPPLIVLAQPQKTVLETTETSIKIMGMAGDDRSVEKIDILINNQVLQSLNTRGVDVVARPGAKGERVPSYPFEQEVALEMGENNIRIIAYDDEGLTRSHIIKVTRTPQKGDMHLLAIGITDYNDRGIKKLPYAETDAHAIVDFYRNNPASPIKPANISTLYGKQATSRNIRKAIGELARKTKEYDTVIVYYAGHGDVGKHPTKGAEYYLIPVDAEKQNLFSTAIELSAVQRLWAAVISKRKVFITDCCNSGGFVDLRGEAQSGFEEGLGEGTVVMTASTKGQKAMEVPQLQHGLYTYYFLKGLQGEADMDGNKKISVSEMKKYVEKAVRNKARELGGVQNPVTKIEATGEIYLTK